MAATRTTIFDVLGPLILRLCRQATRLVHIWSTSQTEFGVDSGPGAVILVGEQVAVDVERRLR